MVFRIKIGAVLLGSMLLFSGCALYGENARNVEELGPPLLRLTSAVHGVAERPDLYGFNSGGSGDECISLGTEDDSSLLTPFEGFVVKAKCENNYAVVLVCDSKGKKTLMEDVGCTTKIDYRAVEPIRACEFSKQVESMCK